MGKLVVEYNGKLRPVKIEVLRQLLRRGYVTLDTRLFIDGQEGCVRDIAGELYETTKSNAPAQRFPVSPKSPDTPTLSPIRSPLEETSNTTIPVPPRVSIPTSISTENNNDGVMIDLDDLVGISDSLVEKDVKSSGKKWVIISCVVLLITAVGFGIFFMLHHGSVSKTKKSEAYEHQNRDSDMMGRNNYDEEKTDKENIKQREEGSRIKEDYQQNLDDVLEAINEAIESEESADSHNTISHDDAVKASDINSKQVNTTDVVKNEEKIVEYCNEPFDETVELIPQRFEGCDTVSLYENLSNKWKNQLEKDKFETTKDFESRREEFANDLREKIVLGSITSSSRVAATLKISPEYNADLALFEISLSILYPGGYYGKNPCYNVYRTTENIDYGVETKTKFYKVTECGVKIENEYEKDMIKDISFDAPIEIARDLDDCIGAILIFTIDPRKNNTSYSTTESYKDVDVITTGRTTSWETYSYIIYGKNAEIWLYNKKSGEILLKIPAYRNAKPTYQKRYDSSHQNVSSNGEDDSIAENVDSFVDETKAPNSENYNDESEELEVRSQPTWEELLSESVDEPANWEKKKPTLTVPGDVATLAEAIEKANSGDVIQLKKSSSTYSLGVKLGSDRKGVVIDKPLAIVGETGDASDVVIKVGVRESIFVESKSAMFKGITFQCGPLGLEKTCEPIVSVSGDGSATFKYCSFLGDKVERSVGVQVEGAKAKANFWKCNFQQFGDAGLVAKEKGTTTLRYCEFLSQNHYGFSARTDSTVSLERCHFADNEIAFQAETGGGCEIVESRFEQNERRADISAASRNKVEETDNVYDRK